MKHILLYNIANYEGAVRWHYRGTDFTDVSDSLVEIPRMDGDFVLINTENIGVGEYQTFQKWRQQKTNCRRYIMVDSDDLDDWMSEMIDLRVEASRELAKYVTHQEYLEFELFDLTSMGFELTDKEKYRDYNGVCLAGRNRNTGKTIIRSGRTERDGETEEQRSKTKCRNGKATKQENRESLIHHWHLENERGCKRI